MDAFYMVFVSKFLKNFCKSNKKCFELDLII